MTKITYKEKSKTDKLSYKLGDWFILTRKSNTNIKNLCVLTVIDNDTINFITVQGDGSNRMFSGVEVEDANCITEYDIKRFKGLENYTIEKVDVTITVYFAGN